jgi:hypothetical protein
VNVKNTQASLQNTITWTKKSRKKNKKNGRKLAWIVGWDIGNVKPLSKPYFNPKSLWLKKPWNSNNYHRHVL